MSKKVLSIIETAYRGTLEEQDDTIVWLTYLLKRGGADMNVLLRGAAVNYAVKGQDASGLAFGDRQQTQPPRIDEDVAKLIATGAKVFIVEDDFIERGLESGDRIPGVEPLAAAGLPKLLASYDQVWHW